VSTASPAGLSARRAGHWRAPRRCTRPAARASRRGGQRAAASGVHRCT
jgi:hypothetical protein